MTYEQKLQLIFNHLQTLPKQNKRVTVGFDACLDTIVRPVKSLQPDGSPLFFSSIGDFGHHLTAHENLSCAIDIRIISQKIGGNMPNLSCGLTTLGIPVDCIGTLGIPTPDNRFKNIGEHLFSVGSPGTCTALQFQDGKIMLSNMESAESFDYALLEKKIGTDLIQQLFCQSTLVAFVNWAELPHATDLWEGIAASCWFNQPPNHNYSLLVDLTDCSKCSQKDILQVLSLLKQCAKYRKLILTLNQNEANQLAEALDIHVEGVFERMQAIRVSLDAYLIIIHRNDRCFLQSNKQNFESEGFFVSSPLNSVGAGDTFNSALAFGLLHNFPLPVLGYFSCLYAALYVEYGKPFSLAEVINYIQHKLS